VLREGRDPLGHGWPAAQRAAEQRELGGHASPPHALTMFVVTEEEAAAIRAVYQQRGEFSAAIELRRVRFG
jgi:hypothetical protein